MNKIIKLTLFSILFILFSNFAYADTEQNIKISPNEIINSIQQEALPVWNSIFNWFEKNILPDIKTIINNLLTPERKQEIEKETEEIKNEIPGIIQYIIDLVNKIKG